MLVIVKLDVGLQKRLPFKVADLIGLFNFERNSPNEVGNIGILALWKDGEKNSINVHFRLGRPFDDIRIDCFGTFHGNQRS